MMSCEDDFKSNGFLASDTASDGNSEVVLGVCLLPWEFSWDSLLAIEGYEPSCPDF